MKTSKIISVILCLGMLAACSKPEESVSSVVEETPEPEKFSVWAVEPELEFDNVKPVESYPYATVLYSTTRGGEQMLVLDSAKEGYGSQWNGGKYTPNAVIVDIHGMQGIYDFYGNELYPSTIRINTTLFSQGITSGLWLHTDSGSSEFVIGASDTATSTAYIFSNDFTSVTEAGINEFVNEPINTNQITAKLAIQNGTLGVLYRVRDDSGNLTAEQGFDIYDGTKLPSGAVVPIIDGQFTETGYAIIDANGNYVSTVNQSRGKYIEGTYINGYYQVADETQTSFVQASNGGQISLDYHGLGYFSEGYAPVKKYGKWGYINAEGKEVSDFIFDQAEPVYQGRAYVQRGDKWGVLNLQGTLGSNEQVTLTNCYGTEESDPIGSITVNVSGLNFRDNPGTGGSMIGIAMEGSSYPVYEVKKDDSYTWYRIDTSWWLADNGSWLTYNQNG